MMNMTSPEDKLNFVQQLIKLMKDNQLTHLEVGDIKLATNNQLTVNRPVSISPASPVKKEPLTPEEILSMDADELAELVTWSSGSDQEQVLKALKLTPNNRGS